MTPIWIRIADEKDKPQILDWLRKNVSKNHFSESEYDDYVFLAAERDGKVLCYMPLKQLMLLESLAPNPDASLMELASALRELVVAAQLTAQASKIRELAFWDSDQGTTRGAQLMGFVEMGAKMFRLRR